MTTTLVLILVFVVSVTLTIAVFLITEAKNDNERSSWEMVAAQMGWTLLPALR
jgi:heme/copper-type cytochrome/quinol oxidase subunit 2